MDQDHFRHRRRLLATTSGAAAAVLLPAWPLLAAGPRRTPSQARGPFYPVKIPADSDSNLVQVDGRPAPASGKVIQIQGRVLDDRGHPLAAARVEIWQCDAFGHYHHPNDRGGRADPNFQGFGRSLTDEKGAYAFRTIEPVPYPGRTPHIHFAVAGPGVEPLTTQMYLAGHPLNERDFLYNAIRDPAARDSVTIAFHPSADPDSQIDVGHFDLVLGRSL